MEEFFKTILGNSEGYLGLAFKRGEEWQNFYINYPSELSHAVERIKARDSDGWDCFFVPATLRGKHRRKANFKESRVVWIDYDGDNPPEWTPEPTAIVNTSPNHYHVYWALDSPSTMLEVETTNQALIKVHEADDSGWDATQLLRVPETYSKKRDCPVTLDKLNGEVYPLGAFPKLWNLHL